MTDWDGVTQKPTSIVDRIQRFRGHLYSHGKTVPGWVANHISKNLKDMGRLTRPANTPLHNGFSVLHSRSRGEFTPERITELPADLALQCARLHTRSRLLQHKIIAWLERHQRTTSLKARPMRLLQEGESQHTENHRTTGRNHDKTGYSVTKIEKVIR